MAWRLAMLHDGRRTRCSSTTGAVSDAINQRDVKSHAVRSIKTITINRIAVMPLIEAARGR